MKNASAFRQTDRLPLSCGTLWEVPAGTCREEVKL